MSQFKDLRIDQVISLIKSGDRVAAKKLLTEVLQSHPSSADGWYLASLLADKPDQQVRALERTLAIDPRHENAQRRLEKLQSDSGTLDALLDGLPSNGEPSRTSFPSPQQRPKARATLRTILLLIFIVAIVIGLGVIALLNLGKNEISVLSFPSEAKTALDQYVKSNVQPLPDSGDHSIRAVQKASNIKAAAPLFSQP